MYVPIHESDCIRQVLKCTMQVLQMHVVCMATCRPPAISWVADRFCDDDGMVKRSFLTQSEVAEGVVQYLLLIDKVGDKIPVKLGLHGRSNGLNTRDVIANTSVVRFSLYACVCVCVKVR